MRYAGGVMSKLLTGVKKLTTAFLALGGFFFNNFVGVYQVIHEGRFR